MRTDEMRICNFALARSFMVLATTESYSRGFEHHPQNHLANIDFHKQWDCI